nr:hypothetical protein [uncultured Capnocytophaga sp.]
MENSFFIFTDKEEIVIERFHICTWEFKDQKPLIEFGAEISKNSIPTGDTLSLFFYIPWLTDKCKINDLYENLKDSENSRFIFNDSIVHIDPSDGGKNTSGIIYEFKGRKEKLCILPVTLKKNDKKDNDKVISVDLPLNKYNSFTQNTANIYFRFLIEPFKDILAPKPGIGKSTIIYDIKINEQRNIPDDKIDLFEEKKFCTIKTCFLFNIVPNKYDITFFESVYLKNIRTLEYDSFKKYLPDSRVKKDELIVVFLKKNDLESYTFFNIFSKERIGMGQFALAILINIICGFLLFLPGYRGEGNKQISWRLWEWFTTELYIVAVLVLLTGLYFFYIPIKNRIVDFFIRLKNHFKKF